MELDQPAREVQPDPEAGALLGWLDSPKHRANLFKPDWTEQGIALVYVERFRGVASSRIWVSHFGPQG